MQERSLDWQGCPRRTRRLPKCQPSSISSGMRPADHPEFFLRPPPDGTSRESSLRLDGEGQFWHDGARVDHPRLHAALHQWITRHPDDGRFILSNGYDWTYFTVEDVPFFVRGLRLGDEPQLLLSDGSAEPFPQSGYRLGRGGALYCPVKGRTAEARFTPSAQNALGPLLEADADGPYLQLGARRIALPSSE